jgi:hypothetical protein
MTFGSKKLKVNHTVRLVLIFLSVSLLFSAAIIFLAPAFRADLATDVASVAPQERVVLGITIPGGPDSANFMEYVSAIINFSIKILGPLAATAMIMLGGYKMIFSQGDSNALTQGKDYIIGAAFGYAILLLTKFFINVTGI